MVQELGAFPKDLSLALISLDGSQLPVMIPGNAVPFLVSTDTVCIHGTQTYIINK